MYEHENDARHRSILARSTRGNPVIDEEIDEERDFINQIAGMPAGSDASVDDLRFDAAGAGADLEPIGYHQTYRGRSRPSYTNRRGGPDYDREDEYERMRPRGRGRMMNDGRGRMVRDRRESLKPRLAGAPAVAKNAGYGSQVYYEKHEKEPAENLGNDIFDGDHPVAYDTIRLPFRKQTTLAEAAALSSGHEIRIPLRFGKSAMARKIAESGAFLGDVKIKDLRHNAKASLAVRCECEPCGSVMPAVSLRAPTCALSDAEHPVHEVLSKRAPIGAGVSFTVRDVQPVRDTFLSDPKYEGRWHAGNLHEGISAVGASSKVSLNAEHPVVDLLSEQGLLSERNLLEDDATAVVEGHLVDEALGELKSQEQGNCFFKSAEGLNLVLHRAYGSDTRQIGKPAMTDPAELLDGVAVGAGKRDEMIQRALNQPIVIEGEWEVSYGKPIAMSDDSPEARDEGGLLGVDGHGVQQQQQLEETQMHAGNPYEDEDCCEGID